MTMYDLCPKQNVYIADSDCLQSGFVHATLESKVAGVDLIVL